MRLKNNCIIHLSITNKIIILFIIVIIFSGCVSTQPLVLKNTEYIPPIDDSGLVCLEKIKQELKRCQGERALRIKKCQDEAKVSAFKRYQQAMVDYEVEKKNMQTQKSEDDEARALEIVELQNQYDECMEQRRLKEAEIKRERQTWIAGGQQGMDPTYGSSVFLPNCDGILNSINLWKNTNQHASFIQGITTSLNTSMGEPKLENFINDAHCFENNECIEEYKAGYIICGGKIIIAERRFDSE